ncbi:MAG: glycosyltransferase [Magnetococcus sp. YQC-9]
MKILHIITNLKQGGAESVLYRLVSASSDHLTHEVISLVSEDYYGPLLRRCGVRVHSLSMSPGRITWSDLRTLFHIIQSFQPDVVQTWMYHANFLGGMIAKVSSTAPVVWSVHHSDLGSAYNSRMTRFVAKLTAWLSPWLPAAIVYVSRSAAHQHHLFGFCDAKTIIIENGIDLSEFQIIPSARLRLRTEWGVEQDEQLIGCVARWDVYKDHRNLFQALSILSTKRKPVRCVLAGVGMEADNTDLISLIDEHLLSDKMILLGSRQDIPSIMSAIDLHVLPSIGEGFGNVTVEAMACGTPCVTTDVGAGARIVGDTGWVVPPANPTGLAAAMIDALDRIRQDEAGQIHVACRQRIEQNFSIDTMRSAYLDVWSGKKPDGRPL